HASRNARSETFESPALPSAPGRLKISALWEPHGPPSAGWQTVPGNLGSARSGAYGSVGQGLSPGLHADSGIRNGSGPLRTKVVVQTTCPVPIARTGWKGTSMDVSPAPTVFGVQLFL